MSHSTSNATQTYRSAARDAGALRAGGRSSALIAGRAAVLRCGVAGRRLRMRCDRAAAAGVQHRFQAGAGWCTDGGAAGFRTAVAVTERRLVGHDWLCVCMILWVFFCVFRPAVFACAAVAYRSTAAYNETILVTYLKICSSFVSTAN